ncbi:hypothetical protein CEUSTIGMA_g1054.t1 [Chlamydomonas eustigma]|uniref:4-hydroxyphenylpyruvate dioxygenase n=1 Tax=Chlamydomonas eustigma TaxID=1157962 RepID=A0A250WS14_9CHLO|nr:hypothetical protein CEUSTIGMA_g1054.t1 [Chlamydomonas eustigma]|eukprot:GAX73603.1 hypothetical protein CEUSTIGMA_g1054.t1 [Chlamydomonas eustigma]
MSSAEANQNKQDSTFLKGFTNFVRRNPRTDKFDVQSFHSIEFWCSDATNTYKRFQLGLGMPLCCKSDQSTGNTRFASYVIKSNDLVFTFTAPYSKLANTLSQPDKSPLTHYSQQDAHDFIVKHGLAVRAVGIKVADAVYAFKTSVANGAVPVLEPYCMKDSETGEELTMSEVKLYGDVVLRYISGNYKGVYLPGYESVPLGPGSVSYGLTRLDHAVGNVPNLMEAVKYISSFTGFHEFAEFTAEDVGTLDSGLNSMVLASNNELVLLPINEPTHGTPRKSQIQTYLEQNEGPGLQHLAIKTNDIFTTLREMQSRSHHGGFEFMPRPSDKYYRELPKKVGNMLTTEQYKMLEEMGILADKDDQGLLLQIFTKPLGDRPTVFIEIIERVGCLRASAPKKDSLPLKAHTIPGTNFVCSADSKKGDEDSAGEVKVEVHAAQGMEVDYEVDKGLDEVTKKSGAVISEEGVMVIEQAAGCGGFGKGNFSELFKRIEDYERTLAV